VQILSACKRVLTRVKKNIYELLFIEQWQLRYQMSSQVPGTLRPNFKNFHKILPPKDRFWADPFVVEKDGKHYFFIEELEYTEGKGYISVIEFDSATKEKQVSRKVLERPYHLSYPFVFSLNGTYYMIPESVGNNTVDLYRCDHFPLEWTYQNTLLRNVQAADTTIKFHNGKYWMFTLMEPQEGGKINADLHIFYSDDPLSDKWVAHAANPVVVDVRSARSAGNIFEEDGILYRPAQDCSKRYGWALVIHKIIVLNETEYIEEPIAHFAPNWEPRLLATHTFNKTAELTVIDVLVKRFRF
jgi:hypothetical protein